MKKRIFIGLLACLLALPQGALAAGVMNTGERAETPLGEEAAVWLPEAAVPRADAPARLADGGHTAADHATWTALSAAGTLNTGSYYLSGDVTGQLVIAANATVDLCLSGHTLDAAGAGSAITVSAGATLNLYDCAGGGKVSGGQAAQGGGVYVAAGGVFQMYGGEISGNTVRALGAAIKTSFGAGVYVAGTFRMSGGSITGNTGKGGGVYLSDDGVLELSGSPVIEGNTLQNGSSCNTTLTETQKIAITGALTASAHVGVTMSVPGVFTSGNAVTNSDYAANFFSDTANRSACAAGDQLSLGARITYVKPDGVTGDVPVDATVYAVGDTANLDTTLPLTKRSCRQLGWTDSPDGTEPITSLVVARNTTLYPVFDRFFVTYAVPAGVSGTAPVDATEYAAGETVTLDTACPLTRQGYRQIGWTDSTSAAVAKSTITITDDVTVYPVFARTFTAVEDTIHLTCGVPMETVDLADFLQFADGVTNTEKNFVFSMADGQSFPAGIAFAGRGRIGGTPTAAPGTYSVTLNVRDTSYATLFALEPSTAYRTATLTLTFDIAQGVSSVTLGAPQWSGGRTTIALTPTPEDLLTGARVLAARYENGAMTDLAWGTLSGNTLTFQGKQVRADDGWKVFFLSGSNYAPLCEDVEV